MTCKKAMCRTRTRTRTKETCTWVAWNTTGSRRALSMALKALKLMDSKMVDNYCSQNSSNRLAVDSDNTWDSLEVSRRMCPCSLEYIDIYQSCMPIESIFHPIISQSNHRSSI